MEADGSEARIRTGGGVGACGVKILRTSAGAEVKLSAGRRARKPEILTFKLFLGLDLRVHLLYLLYHIQGRRT